MATPDQAVMAGAARLQPPHWAWAWPAVHYCRRRSTQSAREPKTLRCMCEIQYFSVLADVACRRARRPVVLIVAGSVKQSASHQVCLFELASRLAVAACTRVQRNKVSPSCHST